MRYVSLIVLSTLWLSPVLAEDTNACKDIKYIFCNSFSMDINQDVTVVQPKILFQGSYRAVAFADPKKYVENKSYDQVAAWSDVQKKNLCKLLNLGEPITFETAESSFHPTSSLEIKYVDGRPSATPLNESKYFRSITCAPNTDPKTN